MCCLFKPLDGWSIYFHSSSVFVVPCQWKSRMPKISIFDVFSGDAISEINVYQVPAFSMIKILITWTRNWFQETKTEKHLITKFWNIKLFRNIIYPEGKVEKHQASTWVKCLVNTSQDSNTNLEGYICLRDRASREAFGCRMDQPTIPCSY